MLELLSILVVVAAGVFVYKKFMNKQKSVTPPVTLSPTKPEPTVEPAPTAGPRGPKSTKSKPEITN